MRRTMHLLSKIHVLDITIHERRHSVSLDLFTYVSNLGRVENIFKSACCENVFLRIRNAFNIFSIDIDMSMIYSRNKYSTCSTRSLLQGKTSHKFVDMSENPIMHLYYTNRTVLFCMCAGNEAFYAALYLLHFTEGPLCKW